MLLSSFWVIINKNYLFRALGKVSIRQKAASSTQTCVLSSFLACVSHELLPFPFVFFLYVFFPCFLSPFVSFSLVFFLYLLEFLFCSYCTLLFMSRVLYVSVSFSLVFLLLLFVSSSLCLCLLFLSGHPNPERCLHNNIKVLILQKSLIVMCRKILATCFENLTKSMQ